MWAKEFHWFSLQMLNDCVLFYKCVMVWVSLSEAGGN